MLLFDMSVGTSTMEAIMEVAKETKKRAILWPSCATPGCVTRGIQSEHVTEVLGHPCLLQHC